MPARGDEKLGLGPAEPTQGPTAGTVPGGRLGTQAVERPHQEAVWFVWRDTQNLSYYLIPR